MNSPDFWTFNLFRPVSMLLISRFVVTFAVFLAIPDGAICADKKSNADKLAEQKISVIGKLGCSGLDDNAVKAKIVLKVSRNGKEIISSNYSSKSSKESPLISTKRTEPKFLFLQIIPNVPESSKCNKTIQGKVRMREFKVLRGANKNDKVLDVGDCDFLTGKCTKFSKNSDLQTVSIIGEIFCPSSKNVKATIIMKPKRHVDDEIKRQNI
ncbi:hypothetical protein M3Y97_01094800 [Aphelenchoides bicaudatus]|nr:hypothetical protein M3Y97_01094800 [Aphelenchoides bicaudatus]